MSKSKFPGWRTMTAAQRHNAKMFAMFERARQLDLDWLKSQRAEVVECAGGGVMILIDGVQWGGTRDPSGAGDATFPCFLSAVRAFRTATWPPSTESAAKEAALEAGHGEDIRERYDSWTSLCRDFEVAFDQVPK